ncbi:MAG TPA: hypothetical protein VE981_06925 [Planctomycetota bacterium]|nr:hypothetical protein [Planctomycetota bacterium]
MKPIRWDWDFLIHRHLAGGLTEDQAAALNAELAGNPALRRRLAELAFEQAALAAVEVPVLNESAPLLKPRKPRKRAKRKKRRKSEGDGHDLN